MKFSPGQYVKTDPPGRMSWVIGKIIKHWPDYGQNAWSILIEQKGPAVAQSVGGVTIILEPYIHLYDPDYENAVTKWEKYFDN